ncbi:MAG: ATP-binding cassette domain-containing protein [Rhodospirillales bacterium]|jgi:sodium transport system ATP-binding protein|nr:ATP-binding cassette domain-containing protein [Rhodospirillales bacterium]MBT4040951.1 ATP-binding cassette domain-containing protein [Rhodospirillales bacterium]MBT4625647.1 ATP-binding cassette domain-containing protein [Rhodospirillales bacterium]MBT5350184.1 ATP-binding cassette domain-containing protein [Rhodospirillales bacterium]MBT5522034.1 ATP-binding cassette domain-containing protein [Rhodospirillales bacterium]
MIDVRALKKSFKSVTALNGISFTARNGEVTGLIGPNGAGKTTALRIIYTVMKPDSGAVYIDDMDAGLEQMAVRRRLGVLPDSLGLYPRLTAREHIRYYGRLHGMGGQGLESRIDGLSNQLGMDEFIDRRAKGFSKGQTRKVTLARALVHEPQNLLLDEPTNGLDIGSSLAVHDLIRDIRDDGRCVLFCSHIMSEVAKVCDRIIIIAGGQIAGAGTIDELMEQTGKQNLEDLFLTLTGERGA